MKKVEEDRRYIVLFKMKEELYLSSNFETATPKNKEIFLARKEEFTSGFAGVRGMTNVGKSTFINKIVGKELLVTNNHQITDPFPPKPGLKI